MTELPLPSSADTHTRRPLIRRVLRWVMILVVVFLIADFLFLPLGIAVYAAWPGGGDSGAAPEGFTTIDIRAADGINLVAWYAPAQNGMAIIMVPGAGNTRGTLRSQVKMLADQGFGVLALDPRGIGESEGQTNRFGWASTQDVGGAVEFLSAQPEVELIGGWGLSMGGKYCWVRWEPIRSLSL